MTRKDLLELKRRLKKEECTITRMSGCYVSGNKEKVVTFSESFLNLPDEEYFKYLEIAKKVLSGTIGNNQLQLFFPFEQEQSGGKQQFFMGLNKSELKDDGLLGRFYDLVIEHYNYVGNFLILVFHDAYDVIDKTSDRMKLDESSEVFEYILCAICPVSLSKPGLGYIEEENKIGLRLRDWVVAPPENGFVFPAFSERSSDIHSMSYYAKNAKDPKPDFMENCLGVTQKRTSTQQKKSFENMVKKAVMGTEHEDHTEEIFLSLQESLCDRVEQAQMDGADSAPDMDRDTLKKIMEECEIDEYLAPKLAAAYEEEFGNEQLTCEAVLDSKALAKNQPKKMTKELLGEVEQLKGTIAKIKQAAGPDLVDPETGALLLPDDDSDANDFASAQTGGFDGDLPDPEAALAGAPMKELDSHALLCDIFLRVKPQKAGMVRTENINGQNCIVIPVDEGDDIDINGLKTLP
ncbi:MAG: DUF4317 domain-containing protein [Lachnospiraceae bacterium]|nr:DUF4317 domain-containing protein [Lachnospiraceae bacterium]